MANFHSNTHPSFHTCFHLLCQAVRKSVFPLHSYAIHSTQTATTQLQSAPLPFFYLSPFGLLHHSFLHLPLLWKDSRQMWQEMRQMARMSGESFWKKKWKPEDVSNRMNLCHNHSCTQFLLFCCFTCWMSASCINSHVGSHIQTVHMPSIISLFDALALGLIGILRVWQLITSRWWRCHWAVVFYDWPVRLWQRLNSRLPSLISDDVHPW